MNGRDDDTRGSGSGSGRAVGIDRDTGARIIKIGPGEHYVTGHAEEMILTVLGSCVCACIRDPIASVGGMNHFMLSMSQSGKWGDVFSSLRFGNFAMERLINDILNRGGKRDRLEAKVFGGAIIHDNAVVGPCNADFVEEYLLQENIAIRSHDLRGRLPRRVHYFPVTGRVLMRELRSVDRDLWKSEGSYAARQQSSPAESSGIELFI